MVVDQIRNVVLSLLDRWGRSHLRLQYQFPGPLRWAGNRRGGNAEHGTPCFVLRRGGQDEDLVHFRAGRARGSGNVRGSWSGIGINGRSREASNALRLVHVEVHPAVGAGPGDLGSGRPRHGRQVRAAADPRPRRRRSGWQPWGPGWQPWGPGWQPWGPGWQPWGPGWQPRRPGWQPRGPGWQPRGPGWQPRRPGWQPRRSRRHVNAAVRLLADQAKQLRPGS